MHTAMHTAMQQMVDRRHEALAAQHALTQLDTPRAHTCIPQHAHHGMPQHTSSLTRARTTTRTHPPHTHGPGRGPRSAAASTAQRHRLPRPVGVAAGSRRPEQQLLQSVFRLPAQLQQNPGWHSSTRVEGGRARLGRTSPVTATADRIAAPMACSLRRVAPSGAARRRLGIQWCCGGR